MKYSNGREGLETRRNLKAQIQKLQDGIAAQKALDRVACGEFYDAMFGGGEDTYIDDLEEAVPNGAGSIFFKVIEIMGGSVKNFITFGLATENDMRELKVGEEITLPVTHYYPRGCCHEDSYKESKVTFKNENGRLKVVDFRK